MAVDDWAGDFWEKERKRYETADQKRLSAAMKAASDFNPENILIDAVVYGDTETVLFLLTHDIINRPDHTDTLHTYIALRPCAYVRAFEAAAKSFKGEIVDTILSHAPDRVDDFYIAYAVHKALFACPRVYPQAELLIKTALEKRPDALPYETREAAKRLVEADAEQKKHLRSHMGEYLTLYANKKSYTETGKHHDDHPAPLRDGFGKNKDKTEKQSGKKELPPYLRPVK